MNELFFGGSEFGIGVRVQQCFGCLHKLLKNVLGFSLVREITRGDSKRQYSTNQVFHVPNIGTIAAEHVAQCATNGVLGDRTSSMRELVASAVSEM